MELQSAKNWGVRPTVFLGLEPESSGWTSLDRLLTCALQIFEQSLCPDCRQPARLAFDADLDGWFEADDTIICCSCAAKERYMKDVKDPEPGLKIGVRLDPNWHR